MIKNYNINKYQHTEDDFSMQLSPNTKQSMDELVAARNEYSDLLNNDLSWCQQLERADSGFDDESNRSAPIAAQQSQRDTLAIHNG